MRVLVAATRPDCPAHLALAAEGVPHDVECVDGDDGYSRLLSRAWVQGDGLVLVEHDVVPWPGAVAALAACERDWCAHRYPKGGRLIRALGCVKFSAALMQREPWLWLRWAGTPWWLLEGPVLSAVSEVLRSGPVKPVCEHAPPVGHVKAAG